MFPWKHVISLFALCAMLAGSAAAANDAVPHKIVPILRGDAETELAPHGNGNIYAPEVHRVGENWFLWYGGQGKDGHDRIHRARSVDGRVWVKEGVVVDCGTANHVNDPTVVRVGELWWMFYTLAEKNEEDEIAAATSEDGLKWNVHGIVLGRDSGDSWQSGKVGRPSVIHENGIFRMWFDAQPSKQAAVSNGLSTEIRGEGRAVAYAESRDGITWQRRVDPVFRSGAGAIGIARDGERLVMVYESHLGVFAAVSKDGLSWTPRGLVQRVSDGEFDKFGHVTPVLFKDEDRFLLFFGAASRKTWDGNAIAVTTVRLP